jgi:hypothetical protein
MPRIVSLGEVLHSIKLLVAPALPYDYGVGFALRVYFLTAEVHVKHQSLADLTADLRHIM